MRGNLEYLILVNGWTSATVKSIDLLSGRRLQFLRTIHRSTLPVIRMIASNAISVMLPIGVTGAGFETVRLVGP